MKTNLGKDFEKPSEPSYFSVPSGQETFENVMLRELSTFVEIQERALDLMQDELKNKHPSFQNRNSKANRMNENIKGLLIDNFPNEMKETNSKRFYFEKTGKYIILFKKLSQAFLPMNISTKSVRKILSQLSMDFPEIPIVFVGYIPNSAWDELKKICAVYISQGKVIWVSDLRKFNSGSATIELFTKNPDDDSPIVKPKVRLAKQSDESTGS